MPAALPAISAQDFLSRLGVNTHIEYTDGRYVDVGQVIADLSYLGIGRVRDANLDPGNQGQNSYNLLAAAGIRFNLLVNPGKPIAQTISLARTFALAHPGAVESIEGPNEVNNWPVTYNGQSGGAGAQAYQAALYQAVKADSVLSPLPVFNFTDYPDMTGAADFANYHAYAWNGDQPLNALNYASQAAVMPGKPIVLTEVGYYTLTNGVGWGGVDQPTQAKETLNLLLDAVKLGVRKIYLYQLLDAYADPQGADQEKHFGLFDINNQPKQAATAVRNLVSLLGGGDDSAVSTLGYTLSGLPSDGASLEFQKTAGVYDVVVWNEPDIWNQTTHTPINAGSTPVTLNLSGTGHMTVYDPMLGTAPVKTGSGSSVQFNVSDHPLIVEVTLDAPANATPPSTVTFTTTGPGGSTPPSTSGGLGHVGDFAYAVAAAGAQGEDPTPAADEAAQGSAPISLALAQPLEAPPVLTVAQAGYYWDRYGSGTLVSLDGATLSTGQTADETAPTPPPPRPTSGDIVTFATTGPSAGDDPPGTPPPTGTSSAQPPA